MFKENANITVPTSLHFNYTEYMLQNFPDMWASTAAWVRRSDFLPGRIKVTEIEISSIG
jgi:hypothetical protein